MNGSSQHCNGTPSKSDRQRRSSFPRSSSPPHYVTAAPPSNASMWTTLRWILLGFGIGTATMALVQSVNMPRIRVEFSYVDQAYADAPALHHRVHLPRMAKNAVPVVGTNDDIESAHVMPAITKDGATDDALNMEGVDTTAQEGLKEVELYNDSEEAVIESDTSPDDQDFGHPGPPPKLGPNDAFAACILIKDDNHWLIEWLAYHYHVMPLRYLIVAVDPDSKTSPLPILKRWKDRNLMTISVWGDDMFMPKTVKSKATMFGNNTELMMHRVRQNNFYFKCIRTLKQRNREWIMLIDTDEYIITNYGSRLYFNITKQIPIYKPGNVLTFIKHHQLLTGKNHTCSYTPRYMVGSKESPTEFVQKHVASTGMNGSDFLTQRFVYRNPRRMHNGKNLINIRQLPAIKTYTSVHHVSSYCPDPDKMRTVNHVQKALIRIHHYLGTAEQYFFRSDPREPKNATRPPDGKPKEKALTSYFTRGKGRYQMLNSKGSYPDQAARAWIRGFIQNVGVETARALLRGVGQVGYEGTEEELAEAQ